jgi:anti-sigma factor RsiW
MGECSRHRVGLVAMADGDLHLVPARTFAHVRHCAACRREVAEYMLLGRQVRRALVAELEEERPVPRRLRLVRSAS